jgi:hypothetical protein
MRGHVVPRASFANPVAASAALTASSGLNTYRGAFWFPGRAGVGNGFQIGVKITRDIGNGPQVLNSHEALFVDDERIGHASLAEFLPEF